LFALSNPALLSAPSKKFSNANWPILACSTFRSTGGVLGSPPKTSAARSTNWRFRSALWLGWTSCSTANSAIVLSLTMAASATLAFNLGERVRLGRLPFTLSTFWPMRPIKIVENSLMGVFRFVRSALFHHSQFARFRKSSWSANSQSFR